MYQFVLLIHVFAAVFIVGLVLIQQGKGASMGAAFGSGASQTVFGSRGSGSFLFRITMSLITIFFVTSLLLNYLASKAYKTETVVTMPAIPANPASIKPAETKPETKPVETKPVESKPVDSIPVRKK